MLVTTNLQPWQHWIVDDFLSVDCLAELKSVSHCVPQLTAGKRVGSDRLFVDHNTANQYPELYKLYESLHSGAYKNFFENHSGLDYTGLYPRVEVISDLGDFYLEPHCDLAEKKLTAIVYTDYTRLWPGTNLYPGNHRIPVLDNRCFFFVPGPDTLHGYQQVCFTTVRRCLQINYWTYPERSQDIGQSNQSGKK
jgi:hypothetical protein